MAEINTSKMTVFDFGEEIIAKPDADGRYRSGFYGSELPEGVSEAEALRQWFIGQIAVGEVFNAPSVSLRSDDWKKLERLCELAEESQVC